MVLIREFFHKFRDPFNPHYQMRNDLDRLKEENPKLEEQIIRLEEEVVLAKIKFRVKNVFNQFELDKNVNNRMIFNLFREC